MLDIMNGEKVLKSRTVVIQPEMKVRGSSQKEKVISAAIEKNN
ncbi:hypothetical protein RCG17_11235 [Neobacillus sp. PS3-12]|nr:hypothetical protein [Neobacillus sp. PS3-12]WML55107.1 hypothetical protein RCG17_11235 [Neobacillus sp. PS3-12]